MSYPADYKCPISLKLFQDPVICDDGITYEREEILKWFLQPASIAPFDSTKRISPMTKKLVSTNLIPNLALRNSIEEYLKQNKVIEEPIDNLVSNEQVNIQIDKNFVIQPNPPAEVVQNNDQDLIIKCDGVDQNGKYHDIHLSLVPPNSGTKRNTVYINVVDVSGSMQLPAMTEKKEGDFEYSRLDLVKYSLENIVENCEENDFFALITFSNSSQVVMGITQMTKDGKELAKRKIYEQETQGSTNLWSGILAGLELTKNVICADKNVSMIVLTDGEANENPPRGVYATLETYLQKNPLSCTMNTLGFGYDIDSILLFDIALKLGNGTFCFIPDCTMIGTNVTSLIAKNKTCFAKDVKLKLTIEGAKWRPNYEGLLNFDISLYNKDTTSVEKESTHVFDYGPMEYGQRGNLMLRLKDVKPGGMIKIEVTYNVCTSVKTEIKTFVIENEKEKDQDVINESHDRKTFVHGVFELIKIRQNNDNENKKAKAVEKKIKELTENLVVKKNEKFIREFNVAHEREGQVGKAFSSADWFKKWGLSHCLYLISSHLRRFNSNFKDPSIQNYGGKIFEDNRAECENIFCTMQPPKPSVHSDDFNNKSYYNNYNQNIIAQACCNVDAGCFTGSSEILMRNGETKKVSQLLPGDELQSWNGRTTKIRCILKTKCLKPIKIANINGLQITPYHPVWVANQWQFPLNIGLCETISCDYVYNLVVEDQHVVIINGVACATLGHGYDENEIIYHPYFGTQLVIKDLEKMRGWKEGLITIDCMLTTRDEKTGLIDRIIQADYEKVFSTNQQIVINLNNIKAF